MRTVAQVLLLALCLGVTGCVSSSATLSFRAVEPVNVGPDNKSRPSKVRIFQLTDDAKFRDASISDLWYDDVEDVKEFLGDTLIGDPKSGVVIFPEEGDDAPATEVVVEPIDTRTRYIGVLALYDDEDEGRRFDTVPVGEAESVVFKLTGYHIKVVSE